MSDDDPHSLTHPCPCCGATIADDDCWSDCPACGATVADRHDERKDADYSEVVEG